MQYAVNISDAIDLNVLEFGGDLCEEASVIVEEINRALVPQGEYEIFKVEVLKDCGFTIKGKEFRCGQNVVNALAGSSRLAVVFATIGEGVESVIKKYSGGQKYIEAYWSDKLSNWALEKTLDAIRKEIEEKIEDERLTLSSMWGPGYCEWPLADLSQLLSLLPKAKPVASLSTSMLMHPIKSLAGVMGIGHNKSKDKRGCGSCSIKEKCVYKHLKC